LVDHLHEDELLKDANAIQEHFDIALGTLDDPLDDLENEALSEPVDYRGGQIFI